ncbi:MAG TPA: condensation domain-containing protein [Streptosporangiaceae bacterium]|nr:condensation domain-containing protein [Streptosporangiaceae bacterium]
MRQDHEQRRRRRPRLTPVRSVPVEFTGDRAGEGPLTLSQLNIYNWLSGAPDHFYAILCVELPVPAMVPVDDVAAAVAVLIARHESLRTTYLPGEPPRQRVAAAGVQLLEVCSLGEGQWGPQDRPAVAEALVRWLRESPDPARCPVRVAVATDTDASDRVIACSAAFSHLAVDHDAIAILKRDFADLLADPGQRQAERGAAGRRPVGRLGHQPLDQAQLEATPAERHRTDAALDYLREQSRRIPRCLYAVPGAQTSAESMVMELSSVAAAMAVRRVAARTRTSRSSIVLAAICAVIGRRAGYPELVFPVMTSNRFERHLANYVGSLIQSTIVTVEVDGKGFDELARHTWMRVVEASRHGRYDTAKQAAMDELTEHERGLRFNYDPLFNSLVAESWSGLTAGVGFGPEEIGAALTQTALRWRPAPVSGNPIQFRLNQIDGCLRLDVWNADTGLMPRAELESVLLAAERLLVAAAHGDVPGSRMPEIIGLDPLTGISDRILTDSCWVEVADVQRLVDDAVTHGVARVFASAGGRPLVACLAATEDIRTPEQAHARCMAVLAKHPTAITPRHYVICRTAPSDPSDPAAWSAPLVTGTGRG